MSAETPAPPLMPEYDDVDRGDYPWFVSRMTIDDWWFGLMLTTGAVAVITKITGIHEHGGIVWIDVEMAEEANLSDRGFKQLLFAPTKRTSASIRADAIVAAVELADT